MRPVTAYEYWFFGTAVRYLQDLDPGELIHGEGYVLYSLDDVFTRLDSLDLDVTKATIAMGRISDLRKELKATDPKARLSPEQWRLLKREVNNLRLTLEAELQRTHAYALSPKRLDIKKLTSDVPALLAPGVFEKLSDVAKLDMKEAARCIAFERPTAAAFHLMRASEDTLRAFYRHFVRRDRCEPLLWYPMVQGLTKHRQAKKHAPLLKNLDNIRVSFRNPTQHPDKIYDIHEVQDLWGLCVDVINRMVRVRAQEA